MSHPPPLVERALAALGPRASAARTWWVPGRLEFLGKHTDYAGGPSLICAIERGFAVAAIPRDDRRVRIQDAFSGESAETELDASLTPPRAHWSNYPFTVARRVARNFPGARSGVDLAFASDLPPAAGLSSSSAFIVATFLALADANELEARSEYRGAIRNTEDLAAYLGAVENGDGFRSLAGDHGVGTQGGSQDHTAILCSRLGSLVQYAFAPTQFECEVPLPNDHAIVIAASGVVAEKTGNALELYNRASARARAALAVWQEATGSTAATLGAALAESLSTLDRFRAVLERQPELLARVEQFHLEATIVRAAGDALARGHLGVLGVLVDRSQANAERLLGNQVPETIALAHSARELGATAASAFGAGFGGSVYALVRDPEEFRERWAGRHNKEFAGRAAAATFFVTRAGQPARQLSENANH